MHFNKTWDYVDPKDAKIITLSAEINDVKQELKKATENVSKDVTARRKAD